MNNCLQCGKPTKGKFCSCSCSATYNNKLRGSLNSETKNKISISLKNYHSKDINDTTKLTKQCVVCGNIFERVRNKNGRLSNRTTCSNDCHKLLKQLKGIDSYRLIKEQGRFKGWQARNITSYPEQFWINVLTNNGIKYERELFYNKKYFLDFAIRNGDTIIDLEIDGKQHKQQDRKIHDEIRDKYLTNNNVIVYRVEWNEITTEHGKQKMKIKINDFLSFIKNIGV